MNDLNALSLPDLYAHLSGTGLVERLLQLARDEDLGSTGDVTSRVCLPSESVGIAKVVARMPMVVAGLAAAPDVVRVLAPDARVDLIAADGQAVGVGSTLASVRGPMRQILAAERTLLNLVGRLSGIATFTSLFVEAVRGTRASVLDTRKTTPGLRVLEKYAVRCGGGLCHRIGLYDAVLIKDNHLAGVGIERLGEFVRHAAERSRAVPGVQFVEVEVDTLEQFAAILGAGGGGVDIVLLDNMSNDLLREAVAMRDRAGVAVKLEASGGVRLETVRGIAETGVERISSGAITHHAVAADVAMDV